MDTKKKEGGKGFLSKTPLKQKNKRRNGKITTVIMIVILLAGVGLLAYPTVANWWNSYHQTRAIAGYADTVADMSQEEKDAIWKKAVAYNKRLREEGQRFSLSKEKESEYNETLNISGTGMMGYVEIQKIRQTIPIYHGTSEGVLQIGAGHLEWTSLPTGGKGNHSVLSAHRGLPSAKLFTNIDKIVIGDTFMVHILDRTLTYRVDQIRTVTPDKVNLLTLKEGKDYCTLMTCTPYGVNSHRLLVRGVRTKNPFELSEGDAIQIDPLLVAPCIAAAILICLLVIMLARGKKKKDRDLQAKLREMLQEEKRE